MLFLLAKQGAETYPMTPDQFGMFISDEIKKWAAVSEASIAKQEYSKDLAEYGCEHVRSSENTAARVPQKGQ